MMKDSKLSKLQNTEVIHSHFLKENAALIKLILFIVFSALFFGAITYKTVLVSNGPIHEYDDHIIGAIRMVQEQRIVLPHFLFQLLTIFHHYLFGFLNLPTDNITGINKPLPYDWAFSALIVMIEIYVGINLLLANHFKKILKNQFTYSENIAYYIAFGLSIATPIFLFAPIDGFFYLGYLTPSTIYIIPTQVLLKLPSLALFLLSPVFFIQNKSAKILWTIALLVILSGLAKPNWLLVMLPALGIISFIKLLKKQDINWLALIVLLIASFIVLGWQYYFKFFDLTTPTYRSQIILTAPFEVMNHYSDFVFIKIILSILFPLYITLFFWKSVKDDFLFSYGWLLFLIGLIFTGFVGESEPWKFAGNFAWCGLIACFMLFVSSASVFFGKCFVEYQKHKIKIIIGLILFSAHIICGLIYYFRSFESSFI